MKEGKGSLGRYAADFAARQRAREALPRWARYATLLIILPCVLGTIFAAFFTSVAIHNVLHTGTSIKNVPGAAFSLMFAAAFLMGLPLGLMLSNIVMWAIPPLRRAHDAVFAGTPRASFRDAMRQLAFAALVLSPLSLITGFVGIWDPWLP